MVIGLFLLILLGINGAFLPFTMQWASINFYFLCLGLYCLKNTRKWHAPAMLCGIISDFALVIFLEFKKQAVETALEFRLPLLRQMHIGFSLMAVIMYLPTLWYGYQLLRCPGDATIRERHKKVALLAFVFRTLGYLFMFSLLGRK